MTAHAHVPIQSKVWVVLKPTIFIQAEEDELEKLREADQAVSGMTRLAPLPFLAPEGRPMVAQGEASASRAQPWVTSTY